jgi:BASS family bile acid:Na+ symporter
MNQGVLRTVKLLAAMALGLAFPAAHAFQYLIPYAIMAMLWLAFLDIRPVGFRRQHAYLLAANWGVGLVAWAALLPFDRPLACAALLIGLTPTATASAVVTGMLGGRVEFVASSVLLTNATAGLLFPVALPFLLGSHFAMQTAPFLKQTLYIILGPLLVAQCLRTSAPAWTRSLLRFRHFSFTLWLAVLFLVTSNAGHYLRIQWHAGGGMGQIAQLALLAAVLCAVNFSLGRKLGGEEFSREASQSLGQKNTILTIWIALTYVSPLVALGPTFYVLCHNIYNAWQLARHPPAAKEKPA